MDVCCAGIEAALSLFDFLCKLMQMDPKNGWRGKALVDNPFNQSHILDMANRVEPKP